MRALALVLLLTPLAWADDPPASQATKPDAKPDAAVAAFLKRWSAGMKGLKTLRVRFTQTKKLRFLRRPLKSSGVTLLKGRRVLMVVKGRDGKPDLELAVEKGEARLHYPKLKRLEVFAIGTGRAPPSPFPLFGDDLTELPKRYHLSLAPTNVKDETILVLKPKDPKSPIKETRMRFQGTTVKEVVQRNKKGDTVTLTVTAFEQNPELKEADLRLDVPKGTKTIRVAPPKKRE